MRIDILIYFKLTSPYEACSWSYMNYYKIVILVSTYFPLYIRQNYLHYNII